MFLLQEELKIHRMKYNLLLDEELDNRENELIDLLEHKKTLKVSNHHRHSHYCHDDDNDVDGITIIIIIIITIIKKRSPKKLPLHLL